MSLIQQLQKQLKEITKAERHADAKAKLAHYDVVRWSARRTAVDQQKAAVEKMIAVAKEAKLA